MPGDSFGLDRASDAIGDLPRDGDSMCGIEPVAATSHEGHGCVL